MKTFPPKIQELSPLLFMKIFLKQKQAVSKISGASLNAQTEPHFRRSGILPLANNAAIYSRILTSVIQRCVDLKTK